MKESIVTIPVNEIMKEKCGCPICKIRDMLEERSIEYIMGPAMMEPDVRIETNKIGFCKTHYDMMLKQKNRLSLALMLSTHLKEIEENVLNDKKIFFSKKQDENLEAVNHECFVCNKIDWGMQRLMYTVLDLYSKDDDFKELYRQQEMLCLPHYEMILKCAQKKMNKKILGQFQKDTLKLSQKYLQIVTEDVNHFCKMYDYRNTGKDADWKNSKDAIERAIKFLTSRNV